MEQKLAAGDGSGGELQVKIELEYGQGMQNKTIKKDGLDSIQKRYK